MISTKRKYILEKLATQITADVSIRRNLIENLLEIFVKSVLRALTNPRRSPSEQMHNVQLQRGLFTRTPRSHKRSLLQTGKKSEREEDAHPLKYLHLEVYIKENLFVLS